MNPRISRPALGRLVAVFSDLKVVEFAKAAQEDAHQAKAAEMFHVDEVTRVTPAQRHAAKVDTTGARYGTEAKTTMATALSVLARSQEVLGVKPRTPAGPPNRAPGESRQAYRARARAYAKRAYR